MICDSCGAPLKPGRMDMIHVHFVKGAGVTKFLARAVPAYTCTQCHGGNVPTEVMDLIDVLAFEGLEGQPLLPVRKVEMLEYDAGKLASLPALPLEGEPS